MAHFSEEFLNMAMGKITAEFTTKYPVDKEVGILLNHTKGFTPGDSVDRATIEKLTGIKHGKFPWHKVIDKWKEQARVRGQFFKWSQRESRYEMLSADEAIVDCARKQSSQRRASRRVAVIAAGVDPKQLTLPELHTLRDSVIATATTVATIIDDEITRRRSLLRAAEALPRIAKTG